MVLQPFLFPCLTQEESYAKIKCNIHGNSIKRKGVCMSKSLFIAEKPSVAQEFAKALKVQTARHDGYLESENTIVTWCVGHLVTMSYPEKYDESLKRWSLETLPFLPKEFKYEVIPAVKKQFTIVKNLLNRKDVDTIYVCTDSGREGEYIYRLVAMMAGVKDKTQKRVWIDSQTEEEIIRGIKEAKDIREYDNLSASAYLRAKEDYLMGINFSRLLSLKYGNAVSSYLGSRYQAISVGRVMTCLSKHLFTGCWGNFLFRSIPLKENGGPWKEAVISSLHCCTKKMVLKKERMR